MPPGNLRRTDRQLDPSETENCLARTLVGRIGTVGPEGMPYVVPMNFAYHQATRTLYLHCANSGHLLDNLGHSSAACFEVDEPGEVIATGSDACNTSQIYSSAICFGRARLVPDPEEKEMALQLLVRKYVDELMPERRYDPELSTSDAVTVIALDIETVTGKQRRPL